MTEEVRFTQPWGFSKLDVYRTCPRKFKYQFIDKLPTPSSPALERGSRIHDELEGYVRGWNGLPAEAAKWQEPLEALKAQPGVQSEQALGFDKGWKKLKNWFEPSAWLRVKMDAYYFTDKELVAIDYKTGKYRVPSTDQIALYGTSGLELAPHVETVRVEFWFIDAKELYSKTYTKAESLALRPKFEKAVEPMYNETRWPATPSRECRWCPFSKANGGPCEF